MAQSTAQDKKTRIAIYDMDKTVTRRATYTGFLLHVVKNRRPWRLLFAPLLLPGLLLYALKIWQRKQLKQFALRLLVGRRIKRDELASYLESHAELVLAGNVYPELRARVREEKAAGYTHIMATASYRLYVSAIARRLDFEEVIATDLVVGDSGYVLAQIDGYNCYADAKLDRVKTWMAAAGLARQDCHIRAYSDHVSDAPLLDFADEAFATNPHPPLVTMAQARGWAIIDWRYK
ncbi:MAG: HAD-IB family hydrolase [Sphingorhabdus sp.]